MGAPDPFAHWPDRTALTDGDGRTVLRYTLGEDARDGRPWADGAWRPDDVSVDDASCATLDLLPGYAVSSADRPLVEGLLAAGATELRHAHVMTHDLSTLPKQREVGGLAVHRLTRDQLLRHAQRIGALMMSAYPPGHADHRFQDTDHAVRSITMVAHDEVLGPFLHVSQVAVHGHKIIGAALVVDRPGRAPEGGPWLLDIFRDPATPLRGVGRALLSAALHAASEDGLTSLTLAVSHSNANAFGLYGSLGFVDHEQSWTLALPDQRKSR
jgi:ribosomal protein S18 acetylase RimI-like enzyme